MSAITEFAKRRPVLTYFVLTFAISWGGALLAIGGSGGMAGTTPESDPRFVYALLAMLAGPSVAGIVMTALVHGRAGFQEYRSRRPHHGSVALSPLPRESQAAGRSTHLICIARSVPGRACAPPYGRSPRERLGTGPPAG